MIKFSPHDSTHWLKSKTTKPYFFIIFEDKLAVLNFENKPFAAVIKSREVVEVVKVMYQLIWKSLS